MGNSLRDIFGISITTAYVRAGEISLSVRRKAICQSLASAFGLGEDAGTSVFGSFRNRSNLENTTGLDNLSYYHLYEESVYDIINGQYPSESELNKRTLALVTHSILYGYYLNSGATISEISAIIGKALSNTASLANEHQIFTSTPKGVVIHPFTEAVIKVLLRNNYYLVSKAIAQSPKQEEINAVNYNWYDTRSIFTNPNVQLSKDVENQYYYVSGRLIYETSINQLPDCIEDTITINTVSGLMDTKFIRNVPCVDKSSYIGPITGVNFHRIFNDGPYSSGDFTKDVRTAYIEFDKAVLPTGDYSSNFQKIYSFYSDGNSGYIPVYDGGVFVNANGLYNISGEEYKYAPDVSECVGSYQSMHVGNNSSRVICARDEFNNCGSCSSGFTGFKFASLQLDGAWLKRFSYIQANPALDTGQVLKRALNLNENPYVATRVGDEYNTYVVSFPFDQWYFGPPQLNGGNALPTIAFFQDFDSVTFNKQASLTMYPAIGTAGGGGSDSDRSYSISDFNIFSGKHGGHLEITPTGGIIKFAAKINSSQTLDDISSKFFGMGDNFSGQYQIVTEARENAGYFYTGYLLTGSGVSYDALEFLDNYSGHILGSPINNVKFISGYEANGKQYPMSRLYGQTATGELVQYYYLNKQTVPSEFAIKETGLTSFAELPSELELNGTRLYANQKVENYLPRYARGPYSVESRKFIYPHAKEVTETYPAKTYGFPNRIRYSLNIREEVVKELFVEYFINRDGLVDTTPNYVRVVRPTSSGGYNSSATFPIMKEAFVPSDPRYNFELDFNNWKVADTFSNSFSVDGVDNNWAPFDFVVKVPSGKNNVTYNGLQNAESIFYQGLRMTGGYAPNEHRIFTGTGVGEYYTKYTTAPNNVGIIHAYNATNRTGEFIYTLPIFDIGRANKYITDGLREAFNLVFTANCYSNYKFDTSCRALEGAKVYKNNGETLYIETGFDPLYFEFIGGRRGGLTAEKDGGYNSHEIIGDDWYSLTYDSYGMYGTISEICSRKNYRMPYADDRVILIDSNVNDTTIHARALKFNPYELAKFPTGFNNTQIKYAISGVTGVINAPSSAKYINFDLATYMPLKDTTGEEWYDPTGLIIGPFDRDTEMCIKSPNKLFAYTQFYVNDEKLTSYYGGGTCEFDDIKGFSVNSGIIRGEGGRSEHITTFAIIPSGQTARLNVYSSPTFGESGIPETKIGVVSPAIVSLTPRTVVDGEQFNSQIHSGDQNIMNRLLYTENGLEQTYNISHTGGFGNLVGSHTYVTAIKSGLLYPVPGSDFTGMARKDTYGNILYGPNDTVENYWKTFARTNRVKVPFTGWREATRVSFEFASIELFYNEIPYQSYKVVVPSGDCIVSGEMGYYGQADRSIFTEGVYLKNNTFNNPLHTMYAPSYVSEVIKRVPWFNMPSGNGVSGILSAPSVMKQRSTNGFSDNQEYEYLLTENPDNYNKLFWPAFSDLETLNPGETIEALPPDDGSTYLNDTMIFSAARGQKLPNGESNPLVDLTFDVAEQFQMYDSVATDALINSGLCITSGRGTRVRLDFSLLSGVLTTQGKPLSMIYSELL